MPSSTLLAPWSGPYGGVPPFDKVTVADFAPAIDAARAEQLGEIDAIASAASAPTFANTVEALEKSGQALNRAMALFGVWSSSRSTPEFQKVEAELMPKLAAHQDKIVQNAK